MKDATKTIKKFLKTYPDARERKNKSKTISVLMRRKYAGLRIAVESNLISKATLEALIGDILTYDRRWRWVTKEHKELRGKDYEQKSLLEKIVKKELGYDV